ncbi:MAG: PAS domain-containing sensor histidine kinase [Proteobacteria bacterium]|nr:PAS domain-containing sensor histidine kinase [Pseudomonadota bacterium]
MTSKTPQLTEYAPAVREPLDVVLGQFRSFVGTHCRAFFDALPTMVMALNRYRQVVFANQAIVTFLGHKAVEEMLGSRPGEALGCINADAFSGGCGTSRHCRGCGATRAILSAINKLVPATGDCHLLRRISTDIEGLDLQVSASPFTIDGQDFVLFSLTDVTHESRRRSMERIFFHDVLNLAGGISGLTEMLSEMVPPEVKGEFEILRTATNSLVDEVMAQRDIAAAELNELKLVVDRHDTLDLLRKLRGFYAHSPVAQGRIIAIDPESNSVTVRTDARLVQRVLGNMLKNALEALPLGGTALLSCKEESEHVVFSVQNPGHIPEALQDNIFHRTFSTKGSGRGMGTYSMLLLAGSYLNGTVGFRSNEVEGTVFYLRIPKTISTGQDDASSISA